MSPNVVISDRVLVGRRTAYACCAGDYDAEGTEARIIGDKLSCARKKEAQAIFYMWAEDVMRRTAMSTEDDNCLCVEPEFACKVIKKMDPGCVECGCGDQPETCDITADTTVYQAADADQQLALPNIAGRTTLIISNATPVTNLWSPHVGEIATNDGSGAFTFTTPVVGDAILDAATGTYYVAYTGGAGPLYPPIDGNLVFFALTLLSRFPGVTAQYARNVVVEISADNVTWTGVYSGPESALAFGYLVTFPVTTSPLFTRSTYYYGAEEQCSDTSSGTIPPFIAPPCGILVHDETATSVCGGNTWTLSTDLTQIDGWNIGTVTPIVNGVAGTPVPITLGVLSFGPFTSGQSVTLLFENSLDIACNITTSPFTDPRLTLQDYTVLRAVDANEYAALNGDGFDYLIVSNVDNLVADWGLNVGSIWLGASSTYQVVLNAEVVFATNPGTILGYWQMDPVNGILQVYPQPTFTWNTVTLVWVATLPTLPPLTAATTIFMQARCNGTVISPAVYNGLGSAFVPTPFPSTPCGFAGVTGTVVYNPACPFVADAIIESFTPTGPAEFSEVGVNAGVNSSGAGPNGTFYVGGFFTAYDVPGANVPANSFTRLLNNGTLDTAFNAVVTDTSFMRVVGAGDAGSIGKYLQGPNINGKPSYTFAGAGNNYSISWSGTQWEITNTTTATLLYHSLNDTPFPSSVVTWLNDSTLPVPTVTTGGFNLDLRSMAVDSQGRVLVAGSFTLFNDVAANRILRILPDGTRDPSFDIGTGFNSTCIAVRVQSDDKVVCTGAFTGYNGEPVGRVARINTDGSIDTTFNNITGLPGGSGAGFNGGALRNEIDADGSILVNSIAFSAFNGQPVLAASADKTMVRLKPNGQLLGIVAQDVNVAFSQFIETASPVQSGFAIQPDGKIICVGSFNEYNLVTANRLVRFDQFGVVDPVFEANTLGGFDGQSTTVAILPNGQILVGCVAAVNYQGNPALGLIRLNADGTLDATFNIGTGFNGSVIDVTITTLGDIIVGGVFTTLDGVPRYYVAKF